MNAAAPFRISTPLTDILPRIKTPPYVSGKPEVSHVYLKETFTTPNPSVVPSVGQEHLEEHELDQKAGLQRFLILCSDGLVDLYDEAVEPALWAGVVGRCLSFVGSRTPSDRSPQPSQSNPAVPGLCGQRHSLWPCVSISSDALLSKAYRTTNLQASRFANRTLPRKT